MSARTLLLCLALLGPLASVAHAQDPAPAADLTRAKELYDNGALLYEEGNYEAAIVAFQASYDISRAPALHYNLANCYERLGKLTEARAALNLYRAVAPAEERERLDRRLSAIEVRLDTEAKATVAAPPAPAVAASTTTAPARTRTNPARWPLVAVGAAAAAGGGAMIAIGYFGAQTELEEGQNESYETQRLINQVGYGVAGAGLVTAIIGLVLPNQPVDAVSVAPIPGGLTVALSTTW